MTGSEHGRRILTWAPDLEDELEPVPEAPAEEPEPVPPPRLAPAPPPPARPAAQPAARPAPPRRPTYRTVLPGAPAARPAEAPEAEAADAAATQPAKPKRGRPKGRAVRRQVHFHVDPQEEELLMAAVARYGSQQKGLIAALMALQETELLKDEIARLREECERQRKLLDDAQALFRR
ncbi:MAG TPA: hypothetical protein VFA19_03695 [Gaiellaceae bacterium]|nr:hypothetical protein [Gaiellaceae bacterium]